MKRRKILIVDDEVAFTRIVKLTLELNDQYEVVVENDPREAVATARKAQPDIILLDVIMPQLDGGEVQTQLKADPSVRNIPTMFLTAIAEQKEVDENKGMIGGQFYIAKPVSAHGLIQAIEEHICC